MEYNLEMWKYARKLKRTASDKAQGHEHIPNRQTRLMGVDVSINSHGLRDKEISLNKNPGTKRVLMLGDSITFGWGVADDNTVSTRLEQLINKAEKNDHFEVLNTGVGNTNTEMQVAYFLNEGFKYSPDFVILNYFINDAELTPRPNKNPLMKYSMAYVYFSLKWESIWRRYFGGKNWQEYYTDLYSKEKKGWEKTKVAIQRLSEYSKANKVKLLIVNYPELHQLSDYPFSEVSGKVKKIAENLEVPYLDLLPHLEGRDENQYWVSQQDQHPNSFACSVIAQAILESLNKTFSPN